MLEILSNINDSMVLWSNRYIVISQVTSYQPCGICETLISAQMNVLCCKEGRMSSKESKSYNEDKLKKKKKLNISTSYLQPSFHAKGIHSNKTKSQQGIQMLKVWHHEMQINVLE